MHKRVRFWSIWLQAAILLSILSCLAIWIISAREMPSGQESLRVEVGGLRSQAAEGQFLAEQAMQNKTTAIFLRTQTEQLQKKVQSVLKDLQSMKVESGLETKTAQARKLADNLNTSLYNLANSLNNQQQTDDLKSALINLFSQLSDLENSLKP